VLATGAAKAEAVLSVLMSDHVHALIPQFETFARQVELLFL
jgi:hypothetical protein